METDPGKLLAAIRYMTLATADEDGRPWASPVWFAAPAADELLWVSDPSARHSRNIAARPEVAIAVFDSTVAEGDAWGLYMEATAAETDAAAVGRFDEDWTIEDVTAPAKHRLYAANVRRWWVLGPRDERIEVRPG
ncbi:MAG: pyridoxamine 5'-phosphate oxidase family protein [Thermoleophilaceae bacterium]|nr:pyridoxamine 5'-phosphate oxidase family protein [Thermoleophilaceae bacterium]